MTYEALKEFLVSKIDEATCGCPVISTSESEKFAKLIEIIDLAWEAASAPDFSERQEIAISKLYEELR